MNYDITENVETIEAHAKLVCAFINQNRDYKLISAQYVTYEKTTIIFYEDLGGGGEC